MGATSRSAMESEEDNGEGDSGGVSRGVPAVAALGEGMWVLFKVRIGCDCFGGDFGE